MTDRIVHATITGRVQGVGFRALAEGDDETVYSEHQAEPMRPFA